MSNNCDETKCDHGFGVDPEGYCESCGQREPDEELIAWSPEQFLQTCGYRLTEDQKTRLRAKIGI
jgi:hypothetical protein